MDEVSTADECTSTCPSSYGGQFDASSAMNGQDNDLTVKPYSVNDLEDYQNGVSTADAVVILRHVNDIEYITDPYKMVAADCNNNKEIDSGDADEVEDLILEDIEFTRNSWEWFNALEINNNYGSFQSDPYSWTISDRWSGEMFWLNVSTSTLTSSGTQPQFFYYRSTKVGEVDDNESNQNDWVCDDYSFRSEQKEVNSIKVNGHRGIVKSILPGTTFKMYLRLNAGEAEIAHFQMPLKINYNYLKINKVFHHNELDVKYKIKINSNEFIACFLEKDFSNFKKIEIGENIVVIEFEVIQNFNDFQDVLSINSRQKLEAGDLNLKSLQPILEIGDIIEPEIPYIVGSNSIYYNGDKETEIELQIIDLSGKICETQRRVIFPGRNDLYLNQRLAIIRIIEKHNIYNIKVAS